MPQITKPMIVEIAPDTYFINEFGFDAMYLLVGKERALLIDSGSSFTDLKALVAQLTDKPCDVVITHGHPDHAGGMNQFETAWLHPADNTPFLQSFGRESQIGYMHTMLNMKMDIPGVYDHGYPGIYGVTEDNYVAPTGKAVVKDLYDGQIFDLGERKVEVLHIPGHSMGCCAFLDYNSKLLFSGDSLIGCITVLIPVSSYLRRLLEIRARCGKDFDRIFSGHTSYACTVDVIPEKAKLLDDLIEACRGILRGDAQINEIHDHFARDRVDRVAVCGSAQVRWIDGRLWEEGEAHIVP